jgi:hypothetical protein
MKETNILEGVYERDIDLLVLEEIHVSNEFQNQLLKKVLGEYDLTLHLYSAWHSISDPIGETDILLLFHGKEENELALLLENKIDAPPQPNQGKRYKERGEEGIESGEWKSFKTVILAPEKYLLNSKDASTYDRQISYEELCDWFLMNKLDHERSSYKVRILKTAIEQNKRGYNPILDERRTNFFHSYWEFAHLEFPELEMEEPGKKSKGSNWVPFRPKNIGKGLFLWHKLDVGHAALELTGQAGNLDTLKSKYSAYIPHDIKIVQIGKSVALRIDVPILDLNLEFEEQLDKARMGLKAMYRLFYQSQIIIISN